MPLVYDELRKLAVDKTGRMEKPGQTLQATGWCMRRICRLVDQPGAQQWNSRGHFFAAAAEAMRRIFVIARAKGSLKPGGDRKRLSLEQIDLAKTPMGEQLLAFNEALEALCADVEARQLVNCATSRDCT